MTPKQVNDLVHSLETLKNRVAVLEKVGAGSPISRFQIAIIITCIISLVILLTIGVVYVVSSSAILIDNMDKIYTLLSNV